MKRKLKHVEVEILDSKMNPIDEHETVDELEEEVEELQHELKVETKQNNFLKLAAFILGICLVGGGVGFGFYAFRSNKNLLNVKDQVQTVQEELENKSKEIEDKNIKLAASLDENKQLKDESAKKAALEAEAAIKVEQEKQKQSKKFVVSDKKETNLPGLNVRESPCGAVVGQLRVWGTAGEVVEGPNKPGVCLGGDYEWYKVKWNDGAIGWSIVDYLTFSGEKQISSTGYITGYAPLGYDSDAQKVLVPTICATNLADNINYCNAQINANDSNYKLNVPAGDYVITGTFRYKDWDTKKLVEKPMIYSVFTQCGDWSKQECKDGWNTKAKVTVTPGGVLTGINPSTPWNPVNQFKVD
jgi:hypothetical protein